MFKIVLLITTAAFLMGAKSCKEYPLEGNTVATIYPTHQVVRVRTIQQSCPLKVSEAVSKPLDSSFDGWCMVPPTECGKYTTDYEAKVCD